MDFIHEVEKYTNHTETENGAVAYYSTLNKCLDAFGTLGAMKNADEDRIVSVFENAFYEDQATAMRILFYMRDIRGGQGCRRVFRVILQWLAAHFSEYVSNNLPNILEFGRGDDYLCLLGTQMEDEVICFLHNQLICDYKNMKLGNPCSMLAKWLPSENATSVETREKARFLIKAWAMTPREYRKKLSEIRAYLRVTERYMSANEWEQIDYNKVPSKAAMIYAHSFERHDEDRYVDYLEELADGKAKVNATLYPYDIVHKIISVTTQSATRGDRILWNAIWNNLPNYIADNESGLCVVDTSGSMYGSPMEVALSLGAYCANRCKGPFHNKFITFSQRPELVQLQGEDIFEQIHNMQHAYWDMNTNLYAVFKMILDIAVRNHADQSELPNKLFIISDMQFDSANEGTTETLMESIRREYKKYGYELPMIVYWNVRFSECGMFQETKYGVNCCMVSGYSPSLFKAVIEGTKYEEQADGTTKMSISPADAMYAAINQPRYDVIWSE